MDFGAITDTRTLEDAVVHALEKLSAVPQTDRSRELMQRAVRYREILASWELVPPGPDEQSDTIARVLRVVGAIMSYLRGLEGVEDADSTMDSDPPASDPTPEGGSETATRRQRSVGRIELTSSAQRDARATIDLLFPFRRRWVPLRGQRGVSTRLLHKSPGDGAHHVIVRMETDAELIAHQQVGVELIYVLSGGVTLGEDKLFAGAVLRIREGVTCPVITSLGESELLFIGTRRPELCG